MEERATHYIIRLRRLVGGDDPADRAERIASVRARHLSEAIAVAMRRHPGTMAVHGEVQARVPPPDGASPR